MGKILIHKGTIRKLFVSDVVLNKDHVVPTVSDIVVRDDALFYSRMKHLISMEYGTYLPRRDEAVDYMNSVFYGAEKELKELLSMPDLTEEERKKLLLTVASSTSCVYMNPKDSHPAFAIKEKDFKKLKEVEQKRGK